MSFGQTLDPSRAYKEEKLTQAGSLLLFGLRENSKLKAAKIQSDGLGA